MSEQFISTIDVEEWFQVENLREAFPFDKWENSESRLERSLDIILQLLSDHGGKATFFILGWCAEKNPQLVRRIAGQGHEVASHGYNHGLLTSLTAKEIYQDISRSKKLLEDQAGTQVHGYRAPCFSITDTALDVLAELEFTYDSSLFPVAYHDRYGTVDMDRFQAIDTIFHRHENGLVEAMLPVMSPFGVNVPWAGGGYFRLIPPALYKAGIRHRLAQDKNFIFYFHPWELDPGQPRVENIPALKSFRHYLNIRHTKDRYEGLLEDFGSVRLIDSLRQATGASTAPAPGIPAQPQAILAEAK